METRLKSNRARKIIAKINLPNFLEISPEGFLEGYGWFGKIVQNLMLIFYNRMKGLFIVNL